MLTHNSESSIVDADVRFPQSLLEHQRHLTNYYENLVYPSGSGIPGCWPQRLKNRRPDGSSWQACDHSQGKGALYASRNILMGPYYHIRLS